MNEYLTHKFADFIFSTQNLGRLSDPLLGIKYEKCSFNTKILGFGGPVMGYKAIKLVVGPLLENFRLYLFLGKDFMLPYFKNDRSCFYILKYYLGF